LPSARGAADRRVEEGNAAQRNSLDRLPEKGPQVEPGRFEGDAPTEGGGGQSSGEQKPAGEARYACDVRERDHEQQGGQALGEAEQAHPAEHRVDAEVRPHVDEDLLRHEAHRADSQGPELLGVAARSGRQAEGNEADGHERGQRHRAPEGGLPHLRQSATVAGRQQARQLAVEQGEGARVQVRAVLPDEQHDPPEAVAGGCDEERDHQPAHHAYDLAADVASENLAHVRGDGLSRAHRAFAPAWTGDPSKQCRRHVEKRAREAAEDPSGRTKDMWRRR
jgi:hypothetical protein